MCRCTQCFLDKPLITPSWSQDAWVLFLTGSLTYCLILIMDLESEPAPAEVNRSHSFHITGCTKSLGLSKEQRYNDITRICGQVCIYLPLLYSFSDRFTMPVTALAYQCCVSCDTISWNISASMGQLCPFGYR